MSINQLIDKYRPPSYWTLWFFIDLFILFAVITCYSLYTDSQVLIKYLDTNYNLNQSIPLSIGSNLSFKLTDIDSSTQIQFQLKHFYDDTKSKSRTFHALSFYLLFYIFPLFNIFYGILLFFDGSLKKEKNLNT